MFSYVSHKHKIQFSHIPKSGCQSVRHFIKKINKEDPNMSIWGGEFSKKYIIGNTATLPNYKHYSLVRNPYDRIVSCYYNKIIGIHWSNFRGYFPNNVRPTFYQFVSLIGNNRIRWNEHWIPQTQMIKNENTQIIKLENPKEINFEMEKATGYKYSHFKASDHMAKENTDIFVGREKPELLIELYSNKKQPMYQNFYDNEIKEKVFSIYKIDFETFGYGRDLDENTSNRT
jgi:hypothetical protein